MLPWSVFALWTTCKNTWHCTKFGWAELQNLDLGGTMRYASSPTLQLMRFWPHPSPYSVGWNVTMHGSILCLVLSVWSWPIVVHQSFLLTLLPSRLKSVAKVVAQGRLHLWCWKWSSVKASALCTGMGTSPSRALPLLQVSNHHFQAPPSLNPRSTLD